MDNSTYISNISYEIENWIHQGTSIKDIDKELKRTKDFPLNLQLVDAYFDSTYGSSNCAFYDNNTGETIVSAIKLCNEKFNVKYGSIIDKIRNFSESISILTGLMGKNVTCKWTEPVNSPSYKQ